MHNKILFVFCLFVSSFLGIIIYSYLENRDKENLKEFKTLTENAITIEKGEVVQMWCVTVLEDIKLKKK